VIELPSELRAALADALAAYPPRALADATDDLSATYRQSASSTTRQLPARPPHRPARPASTAGDASTDAHTEAPATSQPMTALRVAAYAATRLPATFAASAAALTQARLRRPDWRPQSLLDVGAGTGAALWAARAVWPGLTYATLLERDPQMIALGRRLAAGMPTATVVEWRQGDLRDPHWWATGDNIMDAGPNARTPSGATAGDSAPSNPTSQRNKADRASVTPDGGYDLVMAAYVLSELRMEERAALVARLWSVTGGALALIAPGTPIGFAHMRTARAQLIAAGATILAPCPHDGACPMGAAGPLATTPDRINTSVDGRHFDAPGDWCHFAQRLARSRLHRQAKGADLAYEDEKYSYVVAVHPANAAAIPTTRIGGRIVRHPQTRPGLVALEFCAPGGLERRVVTRKDHDAYRQARDLHWGDALAPDL